MSKTEIVTEWAKGWPELQGYLKLNSLVSENGDKSINTVSNELLVQKYINGQAKRELLFSLAYVKDWSDGFDDINQAAMSLGESWIEWVEEQNERKAFPNLPNVESVEPLQNIPTLAMVYEQDSLAKYQFQCKIAYTE